MRGPLGGAAGAVVGGRPDQRMAEHDLVVIDDDDALRHRLVDGGRPRPERLEGVHDPLPVAVGVGGDDHQRVAQLRVEALEDQLGHPLAAVTDRQRVGEHGTSGPLRRFQQVGGLDEHQRVAAPRGEEATAHVGTRHAGVDQQLLRHLVWQPAHLDGPPEIELGVRAATAHRDHRHPLDVELLGDVAEDEARREVDPLEVVDHDHDRPRLRRLSQQVAGGDGDGERLDGGAGAGEGEGRRDRRRSRRRQCDDAVDVALEQSGQPRPCHLDLGLEALDADDVEPDRRLDELAHDLVDDRGLAHAGLTDEGAGAAVAAGGAPGDIDELVDETLPTAQWCRTWPDERRRGRRSGRHRLQRRHRGGRPPAPGMVAGIGARLPAPRDRTT